MDEASQIIYNEALEKGLIRAKEKGYTAIMAQIFADGFARECVEGIIRISSIPPEPIPAGPV